MMASGTPVRGKTMYRILIVEDDRGIAEAIRAQAETWDLSAVCVQDFRNVLSEFIQIQPSLVLMDVSLPFFNGYHWCSEIRKVSRVPIVFISSASEKMSMIMAMNMGADDYIVKPFDQAVLMAKIQAMLRRTYDFSASVPVFEHRGAKLNTDDDILVFQGKKVELTRNEYRILRALMESGGRVVSRERLMELLWESDSFVDENTLTVNVNRLRKKLDAAGLEGFIATKFGVGYLLGQRD